VDVSALPGPRTDPGLRLAYRHQVGNYGNHGKWVMRFLLDYYQANSSSKYSIGLASNYRVVHAHQYTKAWAVGLGLQKMEKLLGPANLFYGYDLSYEQGDLIRKTIRYYFSQSTFTGMGIKLVGERGGPIPDVQYFSLFFESPRLLFLGFRW
jgi:hypothetical protein